MRFVTLQVAAVAALMPAAALANPINVEPGTFGGGSGGNLEFNSCTDPRPVGINGGVVACVNAEPMNYVYVYGDEDVTYEEGGGQAKIKDTAEDGFGSLTLDFIDDTVSFTRLTVNIIGIKKSGGGTVDFGNGFVFAFDDNGENKFDITFAPGVNSYTFYASEGIWAEIKQVRFKFEGDTDVPEPGALGLLGLGLAGIGFARRRRG